MSEEKKVTTETAAGRKTPPGGLVPCRKSCCASLAELKAKGVPPERWPLHVPDPESQVAEREYVELLERVARELDVDPLLASRFAPRPREGRRSRSSN
jgi:hypothetical protein